MTEKVIFESYPTRPDRADSALVVTIGAGELITIKQGVNPPDEVILLPSELMLIMGAYNTYSGRDRAAGDKR